MEPEVFQLFLPMMDTSGEQKTTPFSRLRCAEALHGTARRDAFTTSVNDVAYSASQNTWIAVGAGTIGGTSSVDGISWATVTGIGSTLQRDLVTHSILVELTKQ